MINSVGYVQNTSGYANGVGNGYASYPYLNSANQADEFVNSNPEANKKKSKTKKWVIGLGLAAAVTAAFLLMKGKVGEAKGQIENVFKNIDFKPATTKAEAIEFARANLGVKTYDEKMPVELMNWVNEGLTNVKNVTKGKAKMFNHITYDNVSARNPFALASTYTGGLKDGTLNLNEGTIKVGYFGQHVKDRVLSRAGRNDVFFKDANGHIQIKSLFNNGEPAQNFLKSLNEYIANPSAFSFNKEVKLYEDFRSIINSKNSFIKAPYSKIENLYKNENVVELLKSKGIYKDLSEIRKLKTPEQRKLLINFGDTCADNGIGLVMDWKPGDPFSTIYHEAAHLSHRDAAGYSLYRSMGKPKECIANTGRVSDITEEFLNNEKTQQTVNKISEYAATSPLEYVAETGAELIKRALAGGEKLPEDVINLFEKYRGPSAFAA